MTKRIHLGHRKEIGMGAIPTSAPGEHCAVRFYDYRFVRQRLQRAIINRLSRVQSNEHVPVDTCSLTDVSKELSGLGRQTVYFVVWIRWDSDLQENFWRTNVTAYNSEKP